MSALPTRREAVGWTIVWKAPEYEPFRVDQRPVVPCSGAFHVFETAPQAEASKATLPAETQLFCEVVRVRVFLEDPEE